MEDHNFRLDRHRYQNGSIRLACKSPILDIPLPISRLTSFSLLQLRLLNALRFVLPCQRAKHGPTPDSIFQPLVTFSHCSLSEMDFNWHSKRASLSPHMR